MKRLKNNKCYLVYNKYFTCKGVYEDTIELILKFKPILN